jgi:hypothetical protein
MNVESIVCILLGILLVFLAWKAGEYWKEKEHYRCRVFELTDGKEGSNLVKVVPETTLPTEWLHNNCDEYFRRNDVVALTKNPNHTMNVVLGNGHTINTRLELDDLKEVLGISFSCSVNEELAFRKKMYKKEGDV